MAVYPLRATSITICSVSEFAVDATAVSETEVVVSAAMVVVSETVVTASAAVVAAASVSEAVVVVVTAEVSVVIFSSVVVLHPAAHKIMSRAAVIAIFLIAFPLCKQKALRLHNSLRACYRCTTSVYPFKKRTLRTL